MNAEEAKKILSLYRPGTADEQDAEFCEARRLCDSQPELRNWFENHCAVYLALRSKFKAVPVPEGLKEQILAERKIHVTPFVRRRSALMVMAVAAIAVSAAVLVWQMPPKDDISFAAYRERMVDYALRGYGMDLNTNDLAQIRDYFAGKNAIADYVLPTGLQSNAEPIGCVMLSWQSKPVTMICFRSGKPMPPGETSDVWLFVVDHTNVPDASESASPKLSKVNRGSAASWTSGGKTYVLAVDGDQEMLKKYL